MGHGGISSGIVRYPRPSLCKPRRVQYGLDSCGDIAVSGFTFYEYRVSSTLGSERSASVGEWARGTDVAAGGACVTVRSRGYAVRS